MTRQIKQGRADRTRCANDQDHGTFRKIAITSQHLKSGEIGKRDTHRFGGIDAIGDRHEGPRRADRILSVAADDTQISDHLALERCCYAGTKLLDDAHDLIARSERQRSLKVRIAAAPNHGIGKAGAGGEYLDANLPRRRFGDSRLLRHLQDFGTAEPRDAEVLPRHSHSIDARSMRVEREAPRRVADTSPGFYPPKYP